MNEESILSSINPKIPIILASGSESRKVMLEDAGLNFKVITSEVNEDIIKEEFLHLSYPEKVIKLASAKALEVSKSYPDSIVIGGDQMCVLDNVLFDKPGSTAKAIANLKQLSGKTHYQHSGVCLFKDSKSIWEYSEAVSYTHLRAHET